MNYEKINAYLVKDYCGKQLSMYQHDEEAKMWYFTDTACAVIWAVPDCMCFVNPPRDSRKQIISKVGRMLQDASKAAVELVDTGVETVIDKKIRARVFRHLETDEQILVNTDYLKFFEHKGCSVGYFGTSPKAPVVVMEHGDAVGIIMPICNHTVKL